MGNGSQLKNFINIGYFINLTLVILHFPTLNTIPKKDLIKIQEKIFGKNRTILNFGHGFLQVLGKFYGIQVTPKSNYKY